MGSMHTGLEDSREGIAKLAAFYQERARGGVGLIVTGGFAPNKTGWLVPFSGKLSTKSEIKTHRALTQAVHQESTPILLQILHAGRYAFHPLCVAPSPLKSPISPFKPWQMSERRIVVTISDFVKTAELAEESGYDGIEIMGSEGYLINQFLAEHTNQRKDAWGGSAENRFRFPLEIVRQIRKKVSPSFVLMYRLSLLDLVHEGSTSEEMILLGQQLAAAGVTVLNTGIGWHESRVPTIAMQVPRAAFAWATKRLKNQVSVPVIAANRINTPEIAEAILREGCADMVSMARPLLADPEFANKAKAGRAELINTCIGCNQGCLDLIFQRKRATCLVNPRACYETEYVPSPPKVKKNIAVVGAGPAGLSFALAASQRGHSVTIYDRSPILGGQFNLAKLIPGKEEFYETLRFFEYQLKDLGVELKLGQEVTSDALIMSPHEEFVLATGIRPRQIEILGSEGPQIVSYVDLLSGRVAAKEKVAIIGAGGIGFDVAQFICEAQSSNSIDAKSQMPQPKTSQPLGIANQKIPLPIIATQEFLRRWGVTESLTTQGSLEPRPPTAKSPKVYLMQRKKGKLGSGLGKTTGWIHRLSLVEDGVEMLSGVEYVKRDKAGLHIIHKDQPRVLAVDQIIVCAGQEEENSLAQALAGQLATTDIARKVHLIGGAARARELDARAAIEEGMKLGWKI